MLLALASRKQDTGGCNRDLPAGLSYTSFLFPPPVTLIATLPECSELSLLLFPSYILVIKRKAG